ncbi:hypothetical protein [Hyphomicrobium sp.]|uniref:hypothetical protein n=1 Tax=Hyphomicrobium sp. TaxID=82 RepID=UPI0025C02F8B|nr:hypothetical protein [Hyphomicrobium sp.]MCC7251614.1 hypothetical protein [Hyphomicrobium sp.]
MIVIHMQAGRGAWVETDNQSAVGETAIFVEDGCVDTPRFVRRAPAEIVSEITKYAEAARGKSQSFGIAWAVEAAIEDLTAVASQTWSDADADTHHAAVEAAQARLTERMRLAMGLRLPVQHDIEQQAAERLGRAWPPVDLACDFAAEQLRTAAPGDVDAMVGVIEGLRTAVGAMQPASA